jgi:hypothetical protein
MKKTQLNEIIKEAFSEAEQEINKLDEKTLDDVIASIGNDTEEEEDEKVDDYYQPDPEDNITEPEEAPKNVPAVKSNLKQTEYELAGMKEKLKNMALDYKAKKPAKGTEEYNQYVSRYKEITSKIKKLEAAIDDELDSGIYEDKLLKEMLQKRAGIR